MTYTRTGPFGALDQVGPLVPVAFADESGVGFLTRATINPTQPSSEAIDLIRQDAPHGDSQHNGSSVIGQESLSAPCEPEGPRNDSRSGQGLLKGPRRMRRSMLSFSFDACHVKVNTMFKPFEC